MSPSFVCLTPTLPLSSYLVFFFFLQAMRARGEKVAEAKGIEIDMKKPNPPNAKGRAEATAQLAELDDQIQDLKTEMRVTEEVSLFC